MKIRPSIRKKRVVLPWNLELGTWSFYPVLLWSLALGFWNFRAFSAEPIPIVSAWLNAQADIHTWSADFTQTRTLKSLTQPLSSAGHLWFAEPNRIRWELGHPAQTIAVIGPEEILLVYPRLKRAERYPLAGNQAGQWSDVMKLLEAGFSRSQAEMEAQYNILDQRVTGDVCEVTLQPKSASARKMMPQIKIGFSTKDFLLRSSELEFADGSTLRNDYKNSELNPKLDESLFAPKLESDYKITEPLNQR
jgi:outer membrane lipoprotein carrier protein